MFNSWLYAAAHMDYIGFRWLTALVVVGLSEANELVLVTLCTKKCIAPDIAKTFSESSQGSELALEKIWHRSGSITSCIVTQIWQRHFLLSLAGVVSSVSSLRFVTVWIGIANPIWLFGFFCYSAVSSHCRSHTFFKHVFCYNFAPPPVIKGVVEESGLQFWDKVEGFSGDNFGFGLCSTHTGTLHYWYREKGLLQRQLRHKMAERATCTLSQTTVN